MIWRVLPFLALLAVLVLIRAGGGTFRRRRALAGLALRWQMRFQPGDRVGLVGVFRQMYLFQLGHGCRAYNVLHGRRGGYQVWAFDYAYEVGFRQRRSMECRQVVACKLKQAAPALVVRGDELFQGLGRFGNFRRLAPLGPHLDDGYTCRSDQPEAARVLLGRSCLGRLGQGPAANAEINGRWLLLYCEKTLNVRQLMRLINRAVRCAGEFDQASSSAVGVL